MKKEYIEPQTVAMSISGQQLMTGSIVSTLDSGDTDIILSGGGSEPGRSRELFFDDEDE